MDLQSGSSNNQVAIVSDRFTTVEQVLQQCIKSNAVDTTATKDWTPQEWVHFIRNFPKEMKLLILKC